MPRRTPTVDRNQEFNTFVELLNISAPDSCSVLIVEDASGRGKTRLIERYRDYCSENRIHYAHNDLKSSSISPHGILDSIRQDLRVPFPRLEEALQLHQTISPSLQIAENRSFGQTSIDQQVTINVAGMTLDEQRRWWAVSAQSFLEDLRHLEDPAMMPVVLLFDTFEKASVDTQAWLSDHILRMATPQRTPGLIVVVAGQKTPEVTSEWEWCCQTLSLQPLRAEDWHEYARVRNANLTLDHIQRFYRKFGTTPLIMAQLIDSQVS